MSAELVLPAAFDTRVTWPGWVTLLGRLRRSVAAAALSDERREEREPGVKPLRTGHAWRPVVGLPAAPSPAAVLPDLPHPRFKIQCVPLEPVTSLKESVRFECEAQAAAGVRLVSTFTHDGHVFLVFKRP